MRILVTGSSGLIGQALVPILLKLGHQVIKLVRTSDAPKADEFLWNPEKGILDVKALENVEAVINLAGENVSAHRWTEAFKKKLIDSRITSTHMLSAAIEGMKNRPKLLINASAIGFYGDRGNDILTEHSSAGKGYLSQVCCEWEGAAFPAIESGIRVVFARFGVVLSNRGGALKKMLLPFKLGLGGILGDGKQYMSWIALDDVVQGLLFVLENSNINGAVNFVAPMPVTNYEFTKVLGAYLQRPTFMRLPSPIVRLLIGEMADELVLSSSRAIPEKLTQAGFQFAHPQIKEALNHLLKVE